MIEEEFPVYQRLNKLIDTLESGVQTGFARKLGVPTGTIGDLMGKKKSKPGFELTGKILQAYPQVSERWLLLGEGEMLKSDEGPKNNFVYAATQSQQQSSSATVQEEPTQPYGRAKASDNLRILVVQVASDGEENIGFVDTRAAAGYAAGGLLQREFMRKLPSFRLPDAAYRNGTFRCFQVSGDSMQSTLYAGDWVVCRYVQDWAREITDNRVYVVVSEETVLVKRVLNRLFERGQLTLQSDNRAYPVQFLDGDDVKEVWVAVGRISRQFNNPRFDVPDELARHRADIEELLQRVGRLESDKNPTS